MRWETTHANPWFRVNINLQHILLTQWVLLHIKSSKIISRRIKCSVSSKTQILFLSPDTSRLQILIETSQESQTFTNDTSSLL